MISSWVWLVMVVCAAQIYAQNAYDDYYYNDGVVIERAGGGGGVNNCYNCKNWTVKGLASCPNAEDLRKYLEKCTTVVTKDPSNPCGFIVCDYNPTVDGCGKDGVKGTRMLCAVGTVWDDVKNECVGACLKPGIICPTIAPPAGGCYTTKRSR